MRKFFCVIHVTLFSIILHAQINTDYSDKSSIKFSEPKIAYLNISGVTGLPTTKTDDMHAWVEYSDDNGVYFKKRVILNAQGASSLQYPKKSLSMDFCEDEWVGDKTTSIQIGNWVSQDGFHFKANWIDTFRGGLAVATTYKFYDDIVADEDHILKRAGFTDFSDNILCHPDGFPCIISLNGEFQGVYAWQLKKHRKNMGMEKNNPKHVWFQIDSDRASMDSCKIVWDYVDVKNPKTLTDESKQYMENLAKYKIVLDSLDTICSAETMREEISKRFDVTSVIDYLIHGLMTSNIDGFNKNINFFTYDGVKWFVTPYDLDETFGNSWIATFQFTPDWSYYYETYEMSGCLKRVPFCWIMKYFREEVENRYAALRNSSVISTDRIMRHLIDWNNRVGTENYEKENAKWSSCPSHGTTVIDDNWEWIKDWTKYFPATTWRDTITFNEGDTCETGYRVFRAKKTVTGVYPIVQNGYTDSEERVREWLDERIALEDKFLKYNKATGIDNIVLDNPSKSCRKFISSDNKLYIIRNGILYNVSGQRVR